MHGDGTTNAVLQGGGAAGHISANGGGRKEAHTYIPSSMQRKAQLTWASQPNAQWHHAPEWTDNQAHQGQPAVMLGGCQGWRHASVASKHK
eukprot:1161084-Pelagomonas_calceolata.AAC.9